MAEVLTARGLKKSYGQDAASVSVLKGLDLALESGQLTAILGPSGSGKSTLLHLLGLMDRPDEGEIFLSGQPVNRLSEEERCRLRNAKLGFVFQFDSLLPEFTILENATMPARIACSQGWGEGLREAEGRALRLLSDLGLRGLENRFPYQVSGGERQRAALARALVNRPEVLLADEPTGNLDKKTGEMVFKDLQELAQEHAVAVVVVTHNEFVRDFAACIFHLQDGVIAEETVRS